MNWQSVLFVFLGSGLGGFFRYIISFLHNKSDVAGLKHYIPILIVNVIGSFLIGLAFGFMQKNGMTTKMNLLLITGFLGGFTTYSSFSLDILRLIQRGEYLTTITYILLTLLLGIAAVFIGFELIK